MRKYRGALAAILIALAGVSARGDEFRSLFNGQDLDGWIAEGVKDYTKDGAVHPVWSVQDGMLLCSGKGFGFLRYGKEQFSDFTWRLDFRMAPRCNSGLGIRTTVFDPKKSRATRPSFYSYEIQLTDDAGKPATVHGTGSLYRYVAPRENAIRPAGEWNTIEITCRGPRIKVTLNDEVIVDVDQTTIDPLKNKPLKGYVCLQNHGGTIEFRHIRILPLGPVTVSER